MKRRVKAFVMAVLMVVMTVGTILCDATIAQASDLIIKLHYHREDGNYEGWDVWMWEEGADGAGYELVEEDGDMVATMTVTPGTTAVGFIVRTEDWTKDIDADQYIDVSAMVSGTTHIYVESGVEGYTEEKGEDAVTGTKLTTAKYDGSGAVIATVTGSIEGDIQEIFTIQGKDGAVDITSVTADGTQYTIQLAEPLDDSKSYTITFDGTDYEVKMPSIYSTEEFEAEYTYEGDDLGATWTSEKTSFRVWAPTADAVAVNLYESGTAGTDDLIEQIPMTADVNGTWIADKTGDLNGVYYTYVVTIDEVETEACDPYARATGVNGQRAMVIDLDSTDPEGWEDDTNPHAGENYTDAIIYEAHIRDLTSDDSANIEHVGKYLGLTETGTTTDSGIPTGLDHLVDLGITHLHIMPFYDYGSVDETKLDTPQYNWGYDPVNYNVPEGSYSTDPYNGEVRVNEVKQMVQTLHDNDISVVMDVVYNHVYNAESFCFNQIVPEYFSRVDEDGKYSSGSGCGNDTASERAMVKKYIVDSVNYWADEYHIDGFRFDLVGLIDTETMNEVVETVHETHPDVIFYGEGWTLSTTLTKDGYELTTQPNSADTPEIAFFSDTLRDLLKGNVFNTSEVGYVSGATAQEVNLRKCFMGLSPTWCKSPSQSINYASCHDNLTLMDRLATSRPDASQEDLIKMNNLAAAIVMTSEGIPFMQSGEEMLRSKVKEDGTFDENSYASSDEVNSIKWDSLDDESYMAVYNYYKGLIQFRKAHGALRLTTADEVKEYITAIKGLDENVVAMDIMAEDIDTEVADEIFVIFNPNETETTVELPEGEWQVCIEGETAGTEVIRTITDGAATVSPISAMVLVRGETEGPAGTATGNVIPTAVIIAVCVVVALLAVVVILIVVKKSSKKTNNRK
ncbi:MAG: type I pullulanase [Roseburia sp.]